MNNFKRRQLAEALKLLGQAQSIIADIAEQEEDAYYNLPNGLQESERGNALYENADILSTIASEIECQADSIFEII